MIIQMFIMQMRKIGSNWEMSFELSYSHLLIQRTCTRQAMIASMMKILCENSKLRLTVIIDF